MRYSLKFLKIRRINKMTKILLIAGAIVGAAAITACVSGCGGQNGKYIVDYCGDKALYKNAKGSYKAGENVTLIFNMAATDTDYSFYLNGDKPEVTYADTGRGGYKISFVMPAFDVKLECRSRNTMAYVPGVQASKEKAHETVLYDYKQTNANGGYERYVYISGSDSKIYPRLDVYRKETAAGEEFKTSYKADYMNSLTIDEIIKEHGLYSWDIRRDTSADTGTQIVFAYSANNGKKVSVSSEKIPSGGREALEKIRSLLEIYVSEDNIM